MGREIIVFFKRDVSRHLKESDITDFVQRQHKWISNWFVKQVFFFRNILNQRYLRQVLLIDLSLWWCEPPRIYDYLMIFISLSLYECRIKLSCIDMHCIYNLFVGYQTQYAKMFVIYTRTEFSFRRWVKKIN